MKVLVIDDLEAARGFAFGLKRQLNDTSIDTASPVLEDTPEIFAERILKKLSRNESDENTVVVIRAELQCGGRSRSSCPGLDILEILFAERAIPTVVLSFLPDPIQYSSSQRLIDGQGGILLLHHSVSNRSLPVTTRSLAQQIRIAALGTLLPERSELFRSAFYEREAAIVRHRLINLRAALRMLNGIRQLNLMSRDEYHNIIATLKANNPSVEADLEGLQHKADRLPWPAATNPARELTRRILLVDDQAESSAWRLILTPLCHSIGAEIDAAITIEAAENKLSDSPNAVLLDLHYLNVEVPPEPFEVVARARQAGPLVPIIIFTTEREGRHVRDLSRASFHYFFKEVEDARGADTRSYAEQFRDVLTSAIDTSLPVLLQGFVRLSGSCIGRNTDKFDSAWRLLELASSFVLRPEVAMSLVTGAVLEVRAAVAGSRSRAAWDHFTNLFSNLDEDAFTLRRSLPEIVRLQRNYASHYEQPNEPLPTSFDAVVYLLSATQFLADLEKIFEGNSLASKPDNEWRQLLIALGRICEEMSAQVDGPIVLDSDSLEVLRSLIACTDAELRPLLEAKCKKLQAMSRSPFSITRSSPQAFLNLLNVWFGNDLASLPVISWHDGRELAPFALYVCRFLLLERVAQLDAALASRR